MLYEMEADFHPLTTCNYRCTYCFLSEKQLGAKLPKFASPEDWGDAFDATGKRWLIHITGGEPFIYPDFVGLCERLSRNHVLSINSNLTQKNLDAFISRVSPASVMFINAAVHSEERHAKGGTDRFITNVKKLRDAGFPVFVSLVVTPPVVQVLPQTVEDFERTGLVIIPKILRAQFEGRKYPDAYSDSEKQTIRFYLQHAREQYADMLSGMAETPTIDIFSDDRFLDGVPSYKGRSCAAGSRFVCVHPDGTVYRCSPGEVSMGNLLQGSVRWYQGSRTCSTTYCPYYCEKYTSSRYVTPQSIAIVPAA